MSKDIVLVCGSFDGLTPEHHSYLQEAKNYGDQLVVVVSSSKVTEMYTGCKPQYSETKRIMDLEALGIADIIEITPDDNKFLSISKYKPKYVVVKSGSNSLLYDIGEYLFQNRIKTNVLTLEPPKSNKKTTSEPSLHNFF